MKKPAFFQLIKDNLNEKRITNLIAYNAGETTATLYIYDIIDAFWGVSAKQVVDALDAAKGASILNVHINSPGGSVFEGRAIMAALRRFDGRVVAHIDGLAASAATSIALAASEVKISEGAFFMIHNASAMAWGDKTDLRDVADTLEKVEGSIVSDYTAKTGATEEKVRAWMDAETWFTAEEAVAEKFCDSIIAAPKATNHWKVGAYNHAPAALTSAPPVEDKKPADPPTNQDASARNRNRLRLVEAM